MDVVLKLRYVLMSFKTISKTKMGKKYVLIFFNALTLGLMFFLLFY